MALNVSSMLPSNNGLMSAFSPYSDSPSSPYAFQGVPQRHSDPSGHLFPPPQRQSGGSGSSPISDPSPIATSSNGTDSTEIEDSAVDVDEQRTPPVRLSSNHGEHRDSQLKLETIKGAKRISKPGSAEDNEPSSVIHAPQSFQSFHSGRKSPPDIRRATPTPSQVSDITITSPNDHHESTRLEGEKPAKSPLSPPPLLTAVEPARDWTATPRAQTRQEAEAFEQDRKNKRRSKSLEDIPETISTQHSNGVSSYSDENLFDLAVGRLQHSTDQIVVLRETLNECWTLCNRLASLSQSHRSRIFSKGTSGDRQGVAWKSCWKLCQKLYSARDDNFATDVRPTLDLCRDFCQSLFEARQRSDEATDSVLRVSFELNNHLYNTHDRALPEAFRERTLDFYITLCHRLMKQRADKSEEPDSLLRACWYLAEMLFSLRQNDREGRPPTEELLGSAVQACWELCDLFREGWTQIRPERGTPRPSQPTFMQAFQQARQSDLASTSISVAESDLEDDEFGRLNPETPTTIFEDTQQMSPDDEIAPNILVLGPEAHERYQVWSRSSASLVSLSQSSDATTTSSTSTIIDHHAPEDPRLTCLKFLVVKAAAMADFQRAPPQMRLGTYVKGLPVGAFGGSGWQVALLERYKKQVAGDAAFRGLGRELLGRRVLGSEEVARAVRWMVGGAGGDYAWLGDLYRFVFGVRLDDGNGRAGLKI